MQRERIIREIRTRLATARGVTVLFDWVSSFEVKHGAAHVG